MNENTISLVSRFSPLVDERFAIESKTSLVVNNDFDFVGTKTIKIFSECQPLTAISDATKVLPNLHFAAIKNSVLSILLYITIVLSLTDICVLNFFILST